MKNILFIMADQLRHDYLGCAGHRSLRTPNIDALAARGVRFADANVQSPVCGPSRICMYTGRYISTHGSTWNNVPLSVGEPTLGDHLRALGTETWLVGKSHVTPDLAGMARLGIDPDSDTGRLVAQGGFRAFERDDGIHADSQVRQPTRPTCTWKRTVSAAPTPGITAQTPRPTGPAGSCRMSPPRQRCRPSFRKRPT
ncbi:MAG: sulfatase-like hydrolase/transferase [Paracoccaceae bacterium]